MYHDEMLVQQVLDIISTLGDAAEYLYNCAISEKYEQIEKTAVDMIDMIEQLAPVCETIRRDIPYISAPLSCTNLVYSIQNIIRLQKTRSVRLTSKIEFELIPIIQDFYYDFYFFTCVFGNKDKEIEHYSSEFANMISNRYINKSVETGIYKYDITIAVLAYNKLDYTKKCVESILKYTPSYINYELVLIDNGSTDGTLEYFELLSPTKIFSLKENSLNIMSGAVSRIFEGKYQMVISNDVIVTENYLDNLISCMESDPKIAMIVPTTPNVSNYQTIEAEYSGLEEMYAFAKANNVSNPALWEERIRLCNPLTFYRSEALLSSNGVGVTDKYFVYSEFGDDALALRLRRAGYKLILAKDCFCHHYGSVTLKEAQYKENTIGKSRELFIQRHGIDAWSTGFCFDQTFIEAISIKTMGQVKILGINSGFGSNPLKLKTLHKESGSSDVQLTYLTDDSRYLPDLNVYGTGVLIMNGSIIEQVVDEYDYILLESNFRNVVRDPRSFNELRSRVKEEGVLAIFASNIEDNNLLRSLNPNKISDGHEGSWYIWINS